MRIIFMGTPDFAVAGLKTLVGHQINVVAVITALDKPSGRGLKESMSPVKEFALANHLPVLQPANLKDPDFLELLKSYRADLQIVIAFRMLPEVVWNMPPQGTFNVHASLLPQYRGAAPINWAIINGESETGVTTFYLQHEIDTGNIIFQEKVKIDPEDNFGTMYYKLMHAGAAIMLKTVHAIDTNECPSVAQQPNANVHHAPKIYKETCRIDWRMPAINIHNFIRGLSPYPTAWTILNGKNCKIFTAQIAATDKNGIPASIDTDGKSYLRIAAADNSIELLELQIEGKKKMHITEFLRGNKL